MQVARDQLVVRRARPEDAAAIAEIYTQGILERIATFESEPRTPEMMLAWLAEHDERHPVLVIERESRREATPPEARGAAQSRAAPRRDPRA